MTGQIINITAEFGNNLETLGGKLKENNLLGRLEDLKKKHKLLIFFDYDMSADHQKNCVIKIFSTKNSKLILNNPIAEINVDCKDSLEVSLIKAIIKVEEIFK